MSVFCLQGILYHVIKNEILFRIMLCLVEFFKHYCMENAIARLENHLGCEKGREPNSVLINSTNTLCFSFQNLKLNLL